jgi:choline dehydrogenase
MSIEEFDYVVVGGGSGGCAVASRLTEDPNVSVCVLEAGTSDNSVFIHAPAGLIAMMPTKYKNWGFKTVPQKGLSGRQGYQPRGKVLGGSSSTNAMLYVRGNRWDYDNWAALGNAGWSYEEVLPYFKRSENNETHRNSPYHGTGGPLNVAELRAPSAIDKAFLAACAMNGVPYNPDYNGEEQFGSFMYQVTQVTQVNGERYSAAKAYITPHLSRPNLSVRCNATTSRVVFEGKRARGRLHGRRRREGSARPPRGHPDGGRIRFAAAAHALGHRSRRRTATPGHPGAARSPRRRAEPARPHRPHPELQDQQQQGHLRPVHRRLGPADRRDGRLAVQPARRHHLQLRRGRRVPEIVA